MTGGCWEPEQGSGGQRSGGLLLAGNQGGLRPPLFTLHNKQFAEISALPP